MDEGHFCDPTLGGAPEGCSFHLGHLESTLSGALEAGWRTATCGEWLREPVPEPVLVLRHDIDALPVRALDIGLLEHRLGIRASFFVRVHANEYNAFGFDTVAVLRRLAAMGHEIGLHAEPNDLEAATGCPPDQVLADSARLLSTVAGVPVRGVAAHNDVTPDNNLDYFVPGRARALGFDYEAYDEDNLDLFRTSTYVTDGHYWRWRSFVDGRRTEDGRCLCRHLAAGPGRLYALLHPHVWYARHFQRVETGHLAAAPRPGRFGATA